jgi:LysR family transcriptional regulator, regulator for genes of the gallate degradation pathway
MENDLPNLRHLRAFREVALQGSISQASERVFLSQPAITQAIAKLERQLDISLFERHSNGMRLTEGGTLFAERVERALELIRNGTHEALRAGGDKSSRRAATTDQLLSTSQLLSTTQLRSLVAVADARNFSLAARAIGTSQPALFRAARELESLMGTALFQKTAQGINLTRPGQILVQQVKLAFAELAQGFAEVGALNGRDTGCIVVGAMPLSRHFIVPTAINAFARQRPEVEVHVAEGSYAELLHELRHGEIDVLVGALRTPVPVDDVIQEHLFDDLLSIVARVGHPLAGKTKIAIGDLAAFPWAVPRAGTPTRDCFEALFHGTRHARPAGLVESSSLILIRALLLDSDRLTLISNHQIRMEARQDLLTTLPYNLSGTRRPIGLTTRVGWRPTATQKLFLDLLRAAGRYSEIE